MPQKTFRAEQIVRKLRQAGVLMPQGKTVSQAATAHATSADSGGEVRHTKISSPDRTGAWVGLFFLSVFGERTAAGTRELLAQAGLQVDRVVPTGTVSVIVGRPCLRGTRYGKPLSHESDRAAHRNQAYVAP